MSLPDVVINIQDGALGQVPPSIAGASLKIGVCSAGIVGTLYAQNDNGVARTNLGQGPMVEAVAHTLTQAGGPVYALPIEPSAYGSSGAISHTGSGSATITAGTTDTVGGIGAGPAEAIALKIVTGGANGTATFSYKLGSGAYSNPILIVSGASPHRIPGTLTTVTWAAAQTWVADDVYTIATTSVTTLVGSGPVASNVTHTSSPLDGYKIKITITTAGALGTAVFTYSVDNGNSTSGQIIVPSGGIYQLPNTGVVLTFSGTFVAGDTYSWTTKPAGYGTSDVTTAFTSAFADATEWEFAHLVGMASSASNAASVAAIVDTQMTVAETAYRYVFCFMECPTTESDATVATAFATFSSKRTVVCAGDVDAVSPIDGRIERRNCAVVASAHTAAVKAGEDPAWVGSSKVLSGIAPKGSINTGLYRDEQKTPYLDAQRFLTMRTLPGKQGYFITDSYTMAASGSDFESIPHIRVINAACRATRAFLLPYINSSVRVYTSGAKKGCIDERDAQAIEARGNSALQAAVIATGDASGASVVVDRNANILSTKNLPVNVRVVPLGYTRTLTANVGFSNPALAV